MYERSCGVGMCTCVCKFMWRPKVGVENQPQPLVLELSDVDQLIEWRWSSPLLGSTPLPDYTLLMGNPGHATVPFCKTRGTVLTPFSDCCVGEVS